MTDELIIRQPLPDEIKALSKFAAKVYFEAYRNGPEIDDRELLSYAHRIFDEAQIRADLASSDSTVLIATAKEVIVGFAKIVIKAENSRVNGYNPAFLSRLYTSANVHGTGVGQALLTYCVEVSRQSVCDVVWLKVWEFSSRAIRFYKRNGFSVIGEAPFFLGDRFYTDLLMEKPLLT
jgi:ribosomal protein S18 acetylase RimI-like enzyme